MSAPLVFIGDSITDAGRRADPEGLGTGWVREAVTHLRARGDDRPVVNAGVGGNRAADLRRRWTADALTHRAEVLTVHVGINDTWRRFDAGELTTAAAFEEDCRAIVDATRIARPRTRIILMEPFVAPVTPEQAGWHIDLDGKRRVIRELATERGIGFVPLQSAVDAASARYGAEAVAPDGVHPSLFGARLIAEEWMRVLDA